jgi:ATPase subunit of ABC transporter with duplicated ATPase domains
MQHQPIVLSQLELSFPHQICFTDFNTQINFGDRIAIIGRNGSGKSSLLKIIKEEISPTQGKIKVPGDVVVGYVPQLMLESQVQKCEHLSGGEQFNKMLTMALSSSPNLLLLDEPTNHLDVSNRRNLFRLLDRYDGTLVIVSHDIELLRNQIGMIWDISHERIRIFSGRFDHYQKELEQQRNTLQMTLSKLKQDKKKQHEDLMKAQQRASTSRMKGEKNKENAKWSRVAANTKASSGQESFGRQKVALEEKRKTLVEQINQLSQPEEIVPHFSISASRSHKQTLVQISEASIGYLSQPCLIDSIHFSLGVHDRVALIGANGSGKSSFVKAILQEETVIKKGNWFLPKPEEVGYLDQHYRILNQTESVIDSMSAVRPDWSYSEVRHHLNDFLFRGLEQISLRVNRLSGGEKARLSMAFIAAKTPHLLILDEITNNLDLETKTHVIEVLKSYPGAMIVISHDTDFLKKIGIHHAYQIKNGFFSLSKDLFL